MNYKFSVGKVKLKQNEVLKKEIIPTTEISMDYDISTSKKYDDKGNVVDEFKETKELTITITYATDTYDTDLIEGSDYDIFLELGANQGGLEVTFANCKLTSYSVRTSQSEFATTTLTFSKHGEIDSIPGEEIAKQKVKFTKEGGGEIYIGDSAFVVTSYSGNVIPLIIPTALGILTQCTKDLGGGQLEVKVKAYVKQDTRLELEQYLINLYSQLSTHKGTLTIEYGLMSYTIENCYWNSGAPDSNNKNYTDFELSFIKSAY